MLRGLRITREFSDQLNRRRDFIGARGFSVKTYLLLPAPLSAKAVDAARFLDQATFGVTQSDMASVQKSGTLPEGGKLGFSRVTY
jgi:hypothetical protein